MVVVPGNFKLFVTRSECVVGREVVSSWGGVHIVRSFPLLFMLFIDHNPVITAMSICVVLCTVVCAV